MIDYHFHSMSFSAHVSFTQNNRSISFLSIIIHFSYWNTHTWHLFCLKQKKTIQICSCVRFFLCKVFKIWLRLLFVFQRNPTSLHSLLQTNISITWAFDFYKHYFVHSLITNKRNQILNTLHKKNLTQEHICMVFFCFKQNKCQVCVFQ
jgi:hypothetical protein